MSKKSNMTPLIQSGWNPRNSSLLRRYRSGFAQLKEMYGNEVMKANTIKLSSEPLTKEEKRNIKEKIKDQIEKQKKKKIISFLIALILTALVLMFIAYSLSAYYNIC